MPRTAVDFLVDIIAKKLRTSIEDALKQSPYDECIESDKAKILKFLQSDIKKAYRKFSLLAHPDKYPNNKSKQDLAEQLFKKISGPYNDYNRCLSLRERYNDPHTSQNEKEEIHRQICEITTKYKADFPELEIDDLNDLAETEEDEKREEEVKLDSAGAAAVTAYKGKRRFVKFIAPTKESLEKLESFLDAFARPFYNPHFQFYNPNIYNDGNVSRGGAFPLWYVFSNEFGTEDESDDIEINCPHEADKIAVKAWLNTSGCPFTEEWFIKINLYQFLTHLGTLLLHIGVSPNELYKQEILSQTNTLDNAKQHIVSWIKAWQAQHESNPTKGIFSFQSASQARNLLNFLSTCNDAKTFRNTLADFIITGKTSVILPASGFKITSLRYYMACACGLINANTKTPEEDLLKLSKMLKERLLQRIFPHIILALESKAEAVPAAISHEGDDSRDPSTKRIGFSKN